jgi:cytochrome c553
VNGRAPVAAHFANLPRPRPAPAEDDECAATAAGRRLFRAGAPGIPACAGCHSGSPAVDDSPHLIGLLADYLRRQLHDFRAGRRSNDPQAVMRTIAEDLSAAQVESVTRYIGHCLGRD